MPLFGKRIYTWIRDLHLYFGLFISPFILVFAISTLLFNHLTFHHPLRPGKDGLEPRKVEVQVQVPTDVDGVVQAKKIMQQVNVSGEISNIFRRKNRLDIPVMKPGENISIRVNLETGMATVERRSGGFWDRLIYLHTSPGPHLAKLRGNWVFTRLWTYLADGVVYLVLFISASGIYLWTVIKAERKVGLIVLGAGCVSFFALVSVLVF